jgi:hypothetical protein
MLNKYATHNLLLLPLAKMFTALGNPATLIGASA